MPRQRGIVGFEGGDASGTTLITGGAISTVAVRSGSGTYGYRLNSAGVAAGGYCAIPVFGSTGDFSVSDYFDARVRFWFRPVVWPTVTNHPIGGCTDAYLEMNTAGQLRAQLLGTATTYSVGTTLNAWHRIDIRLYGWTSRVRAVIEVYNDAGALLGSFSSAPTLPITPPLTLVGSAYLLTYVGGGLTVLASKLGGYSQNVAGTGASDGFYFVISDTQLQCDHLHQIGDVFGVDGASTATEIGDLLGTSIASFTTYGLISEAFNVGSAGVSAIKDLHYDDVIWDWRIGTDALSYVNTGLPDVSYHVRPYVVTGQGISDGFTPATSFALVAEIPQGTGSIASSTVNAKTTYTHAPMPTSTQAAHIRCYVNAVAAADSVLQGILINGVRYTQSFYYGNVWADAPQVPPLSKALFDNAEFGVEILAAGHNITIQNIFLEVLEGLGGPVVDAGPDQNIIISDVTLTGTVSPDDATFVWTFISGASTPVIDDPLALSTTVSGLLLDGAYIFRLTAIGSGISSFDDVRIGRNIIDDSEIPPGQEPRVSTRLVPKAQKYRVTYPIESQGAENIDEMFQDLYESIAAGAVTTYLNDGDIASAAGGSPVGLPIGPIGTILRSTGSSPVWSLTTWPNVVVKGDLIYALNTNAVAGLPIGSAHHVLHSASGLPAWSAIVELDLAFIDVVTANVSTTAHGLAPKLSGDVLTFLNGIGTYTAPPAITPEEVRDAGRWEPLTNGDVDIPELVFNLGDVIMVWNF